MSPAVAALLLLAGGGLVAHSLLFNFVTDDAFISFVYARNLAEHGQLVFNLGERVEGYTNFLWTVILALGLAMHVPAEISSRVLGTLCGALTLGVCTLAMRQADGPRPLRPADTLPALILAGVPGYACWSSGGLETQLFTLLSTLGATAYLREHGEGRRPLGSALWLGLAALTRPEGYLLFGLTAAHRVLCRAGSARGAGKLRALWPTAAEWRWIALYLALVVPHVAWRRLYYGYWVPNTFYVKSSGGRGAWEQGGFYLLQFAAQTKLFLLPLIAVVAALLPGAEDRRRRLRWLLGYTLLILGVFLLYVASVGGDFMGLHRFLMPIVPLSVVCGVAGLYRLLDLLRAPAAARLAGVGVLLALHGLNAWAVDRRALGFIGADRGIDTPGYLRYYTADRAAIGKWLGRHVQPDDLQVVGGAGAQVYYARIPAVDSFGLCDEYVAHKTPALSSRPGHQKFAPLEYVLSRNPTILTYNLYKFGDQPYQPPLQEAMEWRRRGFHYVSVQIPGLSKPWYSFLKRLDRRLGPLPPANESD